MTPTEFIARWKNNTSTERAGAQAHFIDLCAMLGVDAPNANPHEIDDYAFERGAKRTGAGHGWADVWKRGCFAWEYKKPGSNLDAALKQLMTYTLALDNPPLLIVSDRIHIHIHTHFTGTPSETHTIGLEHVGTPENQQKLRWIFTNPDKFKPQRTTAGLTLEAASIFGDLARTLQDRGHDPKQVAHFLNKVLFCLFAEDAAAPGQDPLLPDEIFSSILANGLKDTARFERQLGSLFKAMSHKDGEFGVLLIDWFNGGLFDDDVIIPLQRDDIRKLVNVAKLDWSQIEPSIFGTLFERGLNPKKRSQLGAHYTDPQSIMRIVNPVIVEPLLVEWVIEKNRIATLMKTVHATETTAKAADKRKATIALKEATDSYLTFIEKIKAFRVLDPACGSGNFLYMALQSLKDIELRVMLEAEELGLERGFPQVGPESVLGIELDPYAAELARVTVWIGEIQWMLKHGFQPSRNPILKTLSQIECRDALMTAQGDDYVEAQWPKVDVIIGNPPFLGDKRMRNELGNEYVDTLRTVYEKRLVGGVDLVCYWFEKARASMKNARANRAGLVATNSIRQGSNRLVLEKISLDGAAIFDAWSDEPWVNEGAAVRVSIVCITNQLDAPVKLNGKDVSLIFTDLTGQQNSSDYLTDFTKAKRLATNQKRSFFGLCLAGAFVIDGETARMWLKLPTSVTGKPNSDVLKPLWNGIDVTRRPQDRWVIDFGGSMSEEDVSFYEAPFSFILKNVKPIRLGNNRKSRSKNWWRHGETRPGLRKSLENKFSYIATPETAKHRYFVFLPTSIAPEHKLVVIPRDDYTTFGCVSNRFHILWTLRVGSTLEDRPVYNTKACFETFPFPEGLTPDIPPADYGTDLRAQRIAAVAQRLNELRENWLNPPEWVERVPEVVPGYPDRILPKPGHEADLKKRTLTNLYNARQKGEAHWLDNLHRELDLAVAAAYGWIDYTPAMADEEILRRLLKINLERSMDTNLPEAKVA